MKGKVYYDVTSRSCLRWIDAAYCGNGHNRLLHAAGDEAGGIDSAGYYVVTVDGDRQYCHRVVWELFHGTIPAGFDIDHINGIRADNRLENLRCVSHAVNMRNQKGRKSSERFGVSRHTLRRADGSVAYYWRARWKELDGKEKGQMFNMEKYGDEGARVLAEHVRDVAIKRLNEAGAGYTEAHQ